MLRKKNNKAERDKGAWGQLQFSAGVAEQGPSEDVASCFSEMTCDR